MADERDERVSVTTNGQERTAAHARAAHSHRPRAAGTGLTGRVARVLASAFALALLPATAASAATPWAGGKSGGRDIPHILIGGAVVLLILGLLYLIFRLLRRRAGG